MPGWKTMPTGLRKPLAKGSSSPFTTLKISAPGRKSETLSRLPISSIKAPSAPKAKLRVPCIAVRRRSLALVTRSSLPALVAPGT